MKVIGMTKTDSGSDQYICTVTHNELERFLNLYYNRAAGELSKLKIGDTLDLGRGHDFARQVCEALVKTEDFIKANQEVVRAILTGLNIRALQEQAQAKLAEDKLNTATATASAAAGA